MVREWDNEESVCYLENEKDLETKSAMARICRVLNHKGVKNMEYGFRNEGKLSPGLQRQ